MKEMKTPLRQLSLRKNTSLLDSAVSCISEHHGKTMQALTLNGLDELSLDVMTDLAKACISLKSIDVSWIRSRVALTQICQ